MQLTETDFLGDFPDNVQNQNTNLLHIGPNDVSLPYGMGESTESAGWLGVGKLSLPV